MKTRLLTLILTLFTTLTIAFGQTNPKDGAVIKMESYDLSVSIDQTIETTVQLVRAPRFSKAKIDELVIQEKEGIEIFLTPVENLPETYTLAITPISIEPGIYSFTIKAEGKMAYKVKQTMFMLTVTGKDPLATTNQ